MSYTNKELSKLDAVEIYKLILDNKIKQFPQGYWKNENSRKNAKNITEYFIFNVLKCNETNILDQVSLEIVSKYKLTGMLRLVYTGKLQNMISDVVPNFNIKDKMKTDKFRKKQSKIIKNLSEDKWQRIKHGIRTNRYTKQYGEKLSESQKGENNNQHKLTEKDIPKIRQLLSEGYSAQEIGNMFGVARTTINDIKMKRSWRHLSE